MFRYNPKANYQPNGGWYLQILSGKDLYKQTIVVSAGTHDTFPARFLNIFVDYPLGQMHVRDKLWTDWNEGPMRLWQTQLNFTVWCTLSTCGVSSAHLNYKAHRMIRSVYCFHVVFFIMWGKFWKDYRFLCHTRPVLMQLITVILSQIFKNLWGLWSP